MSISRPRLGEFPVRNRSVGSNSEMVHLACYSCTKSNRVIDFLVSKGYQVDLESVHGRPLLVKSKKKRRRGVSQLR